VSLAGELHQCTGSDRAAAVPLGPVGCICLSRHTDGVMGHTVTTDPPVRRPRSQRRTPAAHQDPAHRIVSATTRHESDLPARRVPTYERIPRPHPRPGSSASRILHSGPAIHSRACVAQTSGVPRRSPHTWVAPCPTTWPRSHQPRSPSSPRTRIPAHLCRTPR